MITILQNQNFTKYFQIFAFGKYIDEVDRKSKAMRIAKQIAREHQQDFINVDGYMKKVNS
jgi:hypothetical protein